MQSIRWDYAVLFRPLIVRLLFFLPFFKKTCKPLSPDQIERESNRTIAIGLASISFTGVIGISVLESATQKQLLQQPVFYLLISFLFYL